MPQDALQGKHDALVGVFTTARWLRCWLPVQPASWFTVPSPFPCNSAGVTVTTPAKENPLTKLVQGLRLPDRI
ncbi:hypothetical protein [Acidithiobacillus sulfurivorans]|uniref:Uncharacterized protein n=1 Tax=Acidithiobacillus sulfurivorans TaxID=1958756 RepID=A0ABS5ZVF6_9PROT|nr:hypothetical protein [Acidithiobacillus sulfurivorans]MBU2759129.1 hypothetical protein [Acidithiobacillus sulfurivorans]